MPAAVFKTRRSFRVRLLATAIEIVRRVAFPFALLVAVFFAGTGGYYALGLAHGRAWPIIDCAYMTAITLTTVGYGDVLGAGDFQLGKIYTMLLLLTGMGATLYSVSAITAFIVEGHLRRAFEETQMESLIERLSGHTVICGAGGTGSAVVAEHVAVKRPCVLIDKDPKLLASFAERYPKLPYIEGDASSEEILTQAGIHRAGALVATLGDDRDDLFLIVTARYLRKDLHIVAECRSPESAPKLQLAGADYVVSPSAIGGMRIASQVLRPAVVEFLDTMLRDQNASARVSEVSIQPGSALASKTLAEGIGPEVGVSVVALRKAGEKAFTYAPAASSRLEPGTTLVVIGPIDRLPQIERLSQRD